MDDIVLDRFRLIPTRRNIVLAISGGVDSMVLLHSMQTYASQMEWRIIVAHFNHQLRGEASDLDEHFVIQTARQLGLTVEVGRGNVIQLQKETGWSLEMAARRLRHNFLASVAIKMESPVIVTAHHADDQVELFFLRILRGAGPASIIGMQPSNPSPSNPNISLVRPFLNLPKTHLLNYAKIHKVQYREDTSNQSVTIPRNILRHNVLPILHSLQPELHKKLHELTTLIKSEHSYLDHIISEWFTSMTPPYADLHIALQRRIIVQQMLQFNIPPEFRQVEWLRKNPEKSLSINPQLALVLNKNGIIQSAKPNISSSSSDEYILQLSESSGVSTFNGITIEWSIQHACQEDVKKFTTLNQVIFDADKVGHFAKLRFWKPGDRFHPIGMKSSIKLQDCFTNLKIDVHKRHHLVIAETAQREIFWVQDIRISECFKLDKTTQKGLIWHWHC